MAEQRTPIVNKMVDFGGGHHVGWWEENNIGPRQLLIEVTANTVIFSCCEGEHAERRVNFVVRHEKGLDIAVALAGAFGLECARGKTDQQHADRLSRAVHEQEELRAMTDKELRGYWNRLSVKRDEARRVINTLNRESDATFAEITRRGLVAV